MSICRTINPFTCLRDYRELDMLITTRTQLMAWVQIARETRASLRITMRFGYPEGSIPVEHWKKEYNEKIRIVKKQFEEYRFRCKCANMNINEAMAFRAKLVEFMEENR